MAPPLPNARAARLPHRRPFENDESNRAGVALAYITRGEREALELCFSADCTPAQISGTLHIPLGAIKAQISRGLFGFVHALSLEGPASRDLSLVRSGQKSHQVMTLRHFNTYE